MANRRRGEVAATLGGRPCTLCLTLGALAELEDAFAVADLAALGDRFGSGRLSGRDLATLLAVGLRGGGHTVTDEEVRALPAADLDAMVAAVADLLRTTFGDQAAGGPASHPPGPQEA